ncbi:hypothetical protein [Mariniphaga sediminis]|uniref:hypothetical protein n=1 Tax=Mariniphaga sediminis TaxID=1628158 RepID=UPI003569DC11
MSFKDHYIQLGTTQSELRIKILSELEITPKTFNIKLHADSWSAIERAKVEEITESHFNNLIYQEP